MAVPDARFEFQIGGTWTDVTGHARSAGGGASHDRGRPENSARVNSTRAAFTVASPAGLYSNRNPRSPYFGLLERNTGVRATVAGPTYLTAPNPDTTTAAATTPDVAALDVTGDLDIRMDLSPTSWTTAETVDLVAKHESAGDQRSWIVFVSGGRPILRWSSAGTSATIKDVFATAPIIDRPYGRRALRITLDVNNGSGGHTVTFYTAPTIAGPWTQLGAPVTGAGTTSVFASSAPIELGNLNDVASPTMPGKWHAFQLRNGIDGPAVANVDFTAQTPGATGFTDTAGRVWSVTAAGSLSDRWPRFNAYIAEWPTSWHPSGHNITAALRASGMLRRLEQGAKPLGSALRRYIAASTAVECWPLTDGTEATQGAALRDGTPMVYSRQADDDPPSWGQGRVAEWLEPVVKLPGVGKLTGYLPYATSMEGGWAVDHIRSGPGEIDQIHMHDWGAGSDAQNRHTFQLFFQGPLDKILILRESAGKESSSGASLGTIEAAGIFDDRPHHVRFQLWQAGSTLFWYVYLDGVQRATGSIALTVRPLRKVEYQWGANSQSLALGYITCWPQDPPMPSAAESHDALMGWAGEDALTRLERLCAEENVPCVTSGGHADATPMGPQYVDTLVNLLGQCEESDGGVLYEDHVTGGLAHRTRATHYNQAPRMTIPYSVLAPPLTPVDDDLGPYPLENDVTVERIGGSSARAVMTDGPMAPDVVGLYNVAVALSLADDTQPPQHASWRLHMHTWDEARYPSVRLYLHRNPELIGDVLGLDVGDVIRITDLPDFLPPGPLDLMVMGAADRLAPFIWDLLLFCHPARPWDVLQLDAGEYSRLNTSASQLSTGVDADDISLSVATTSGPRWIDSGTYPNSFPFAIAVGGEVMTVTAITGTTSPQTFTVVRSVNGIAKSHAAGAAVSLDRPVVIPL